MGDMVLGSGQARKPWQAIQETIIATNLSYSN